MEVAINMLEVKNIKKTFGWLVALKDLSLNVESQKITSLIGPNGAGKTTLFNIIAGSLKTDSGEVSFLGRNVTKIPPYRICQLGIARTYQLRNIFPNLTVFENICAGLWKDNSLNFQDREQRVYEILSSFDLAKKAKYIVSNLPPLEIKLVELGRALATNPKLLLLDELLGGLIGP